MWKLTRSGKFDGPSFYNAVRGTNTHLCPWKSIWHAKDPKSVILFVVSYMG